eukprot:TRINITY_DN5718_c0_g2_i2.p1 TRINITY_DN5718_c0_g2~~TRINITY_DN5718_c0_g2_i2.p1  ORF type:complete len:369 (-),score=62.25 TRINITY_DN5718_c0_g2_i2:174-1280(-)
MFSFFISFSNQTKTANFETPANKQTKYNTLMSHIHSTHSKDSHSEVDELVPVTFTFHYPSAEKIFLAGPFNFWRGEPMKLICESSHTKIFGIIKGLRAGEVPYKFIVFFENGHHEWHFDPKKPTITDPHGHINNIIEVKNDLPITPNTSPLRFDRSPSPPAIRFQPSQLSPSLVDHIRSRTPNLSLNRFLSPYVNHDDPNYAHLVSHRHPTPSRQHHEGQVSLHNENVHRHQPSPSGHIELLAPNHTNSNYVHQHQPSPSVTHTIDHNTNVHVEHSHNRKPSRHSLTLDVPLLNTFQNDSTFVHQHQPSPTIPHIDNADSNNNGTHFSKVPHLIHHDIKETKDANSTSIPSFEITPDSPLPEKTDSPK